MDAFAVGIAQMALMAPGILFLPLGGHGGRPRRRAAPAAALPLPLCRAAAGAGGRAVDGRAQLSAADRLRPGGGIDRRLRRADPRRASAGGGRRQPAARRGAGDGAAVHRPAHRHRRGLRGRSHRRPAAADRAGRARAAGRDRRLAAAATAAASAGRASELLAQHRRRHRRGGALGADVAGAADQFRHRRVLCRPVHGRAADRRARRLSRRRRRDRLHQPGLLGRHHRRGLRLRRASRAGSRCAAGWWSPPCRSAR